MRSSAAGLAAGLPPSGCAESSMPHAVPHVLQRALDPRVVPGRILFRHPYDHASDLAEEVAPAGLPSVRPFPISWQCHRSSVSGVAIVPTSLSVAPTYPVRASRQPASVRVREPQPSLAQLTPKEPVLID